MLSRSREDVISKYRSHAINIKDEIIDIIHEPKNIIKKEMHSKLVSNSLIKQLRHISKHQVFSKWIDINFLEEKNGFIVNRILNEWDKKRSSQRRDLNELFRFLKSQDLSANYKRVIEANRTSKHININEVRFMYSHPSIEISDSMKYALKRNEYYFYKNFEMLMIMSSSFEINEDVRNNEISNMKNLTGSLYYKLLSYSKNLNSVVQCLRNNAISDPDCRFKHSLILEQFSQENTKVDKLSKYIVLDYDKTRKILLVLCKVLEKINFMIGINVQNELSYYQDIYC